jgi:hypothetical protein
VIQPTLGVVVASAGLASSVVLIRAAGDRAVTHALQKWADAVCVKGGPGVTAGTTAMTSALGRQAETDLVISHHQPGSR